MCLNQPKVSLHDPQYRYPRVSTGIQGTDTLNPRTNTPKHFHSPKIPVVKLSIDTQGEYRYPRGHYNGWKISPTAPNNSQRSPTARFTFGTIKQASKHQENTNVSL
ncbi:hypothetical protein GQ457_18G025620 [Hibiscus cannabinus]